MAFFNANYFTDDTHFMYGRTGTYSLFYLKHRIEQQKQYDRRSTAEGGNRQMPLIQRQMHAEKSADKIYGKKCGKPLQCRKQEHGKKSFCFKHCKQYNQSRKN